MLLVSMLMVELTFIIKLSLCSCQINTSNFCY